MIYRLYGMAASFVFICGLAAYSAIDRTANYKPARASVFLVDRKCDQTAGLELRFSKHRSRSADPIANFVKRNEVNRKRAMGPPAD